MKTFGLLVAFCFFTAAVPTLAGGQTQKSMPNDFHARCQSPGVVRCFGFDTVDEVLPLLKSAADNHVHGFVDSAIKASGAAALRFDVMPRLGANSAGAFMLEFPRQFGSGEEFFVQWRQRFDQEMVTRAFRKGEGWKQAILGAASTGSCSANEVVVQNTYHRGFPQMYHSCGLKDSQYEGLNPLFPPSDFLLQDANGCRYSEQRSPRCFRYRADQWMTFQVHVKVGVWYVNKSGSYHRDSVVELWVAEENKPSVLVISLPDYDLTHEGADQKYARIWLLPYNTNKDDSEDHPVAHTWYDELIVSTRRIPDPGVATPNAPDSLSAYATGQGVRLAWRSNSDNETAFLIERCSGTIYECEGSQAFAQVGSAPARYSGFVDKNASGKRFCYRVRASNRAGNSAYTNPAANVPRPPSDLVAAMAGSALTLSWSSGSTPASDFIVESCSGNDCSTFADLAHVTEKKTRFSPTGLSPGTYRFRVRATNAAGSWTTWDKAGTAYSNIVTVTLP
ncbi:MAG TPA: fibronectin type III domain-containing protein [Terriglobales bacterium]|nr:fibronectin type III domain-containing protein [Terriglobales bacterium]